MNRPVERDVWILCTYAEKIGNDYPNTYRVLDNDLSKALQEVGKIFEYEHFKIILRNIDEESIDFTILREEDGVMIGDIEYWPKGYSPEG